MANKVVKKAEDLRLGATLARLRRVNRLLQQDAVDYLLMHSGKKLTAKAVSNWEVGLASPSIEQFLLLCDLYKVQDIRLTFRGVKSDKRLNDLGQSRVSEYAALLALDKRFTVTQYAPPLALPKRALRTVKLFDLPVSAGLGSFLDSESYVEIETDTAADYAVRVQGDSMTPKFISGQIVFVKRAETLEIGDFGVFALNGDAYLKKLGSGKLISTNEQYKPIPVRATDSFSILGKAID